VNQQRAELVCRIVTVTKAWLSSSAPGLRQGSPRRCFLGNEAIRETNAGAVAVRQPETRWSSRHEMQLELRT
jgi:hypothetical protein